MIHIILNFEGVLYNANDASGQKGLNLEVIHAIFEYQITHECSLAITTDSSPEFVSQILGQSKQKLEFDFIISHKEGIDKIQKFSNLAKSWNVNLLDIYYFTANPDEIKNLDFLDPSKLFICTWNIEAKLPQVLEYLPQTRVLSIPKQIVLVLPVIQQELVENSKFLNDHQNWALSDNRQIVVGAIVINTIGQTLIQKRSSSRRLFPNCWDISAGGHLEAGETIFQALKRELSE